MESNKLKRSQLLTENKIYRLLKESTGVPNMYYYGNQGNYRAIVLDLMGPSLKSLLRTCKGHFSLKTILMLFNQMLDRVEDLHSKSYVHRDLKPANFVIGVGDQSQTLHLVDFGLAQLYRNPTTNEHVPNERKEFAGTLVYASINSVKNLAQSRCDDLESIGYLLIHFHRGKLPWYDLVACGPMQKFEKMTELKLSIPIEKLCTGLPDEFSYYICGVYKEILDFTLD
ncbi:casein kinase I-like [Teleopsis dalmanni]|uniref:casein kinase I-like n=1 Tax=Teleopsis dalmanni TaxID=139649 RepID=UPI0018CCA34A|nr:casein kinase I-like [Teleopsis dalmanni]